MNTHLKTFLMLSIAALLALVIYFFLPAIAGIVALGTLAAAAFTVGIEFIVVGTARRYERF